MALAHRANEIQIEVDVYHWAMDDICEEAARSVLSLPTTPPLVALIARIGLGLLAVHRDDVEEARQQYAALESTLPGIITAELSGHRLLGLLSQTIGDLDDATVHFEDALAFCHNTGCRPEQAWACSDYAEALLQRNGPEDRIKAMSLVEDSLRLSNELGMPPLIERVAAIKQRIESQLQAAPPIQTA